MTSPSADGSGEIYKKNQGLANGCIARFQLMNNKKRNAGK
jgi:hypothetical protein